MFGIYRKQARVSKAYSLALFMCDTLKVQFDVKQSFFF